MQVKSRCFFYPLHCFQTCVFVRFSLVECWNFSSGNIDFQKEVSDCLRQYCPGAPRPRWERNEIGLPATSGSIAGPRSAYLLLNTQVVKILRSLGIWCQIPKLPQRHSVHGWMPNFGCWWLGAGGGGVVKRHFMQPQCSILFYFNIFKSFLVQESGKESYLHRKHDKCDLCTKPMEFSGQLDQCPQILNIVHISGLQCDLGLQDYIVVQFTVRISAFCFLWLSLSSFSSVDSKKERLTTQWFGWFATAAFWHYAILKFIFTPSLDQ